MFAELLLNAVSELNFNSTQPQVTDHTSSVTALQVKMPLFQPET